MSTAHDKSARLALAALKQDSLAATTGDNDWLELHADDLTRSDESAAPEFSCPAELHVPFLADLPVRSRGGFTEIAIDLYAPFFPEHPESIYEVLFSLRGQPIEKRVFRNFTQRHHAIISTQLLFEERNVITVSTRCISGDAGMPRFFLKAFMLQKQRLAAIMENSSIWLFSTARSGSTWLGRDMLCWDGTVRPMDEPGLGKMFAPLDWIAERFHDLPGRPFHFPSGLEYETAGSVRPCAPGIAPFERSFIFSRQDNQIWHRQNWHVFLGLLRETVFQHVLNEWGLLGYDRIAFKMPNESHAADIIMQAFPHSFMIFLMRDGRDVMKSRFSPFASRDLADTKDPQLRRHAIAFYAHFWNFQIDIIQSAFSAHPAEKRLLLYYEDLRRAPAKHLRTVFDRLALPISNEALHDLVARVSLENLPADQKGPDKPRQTGQVGRFAEAFSSDEITLMERIMGPNLRRFGYALSAL